MNIISFILAGDRVASLLSDHWPKIGLGGDWRTSCEVPPSGLRAASIGRARSDSNPKVETEGVKPDRIFSEYLFPFCEVVLWLHLS